MWWVKRHVVPWYWMAFPALSRSLGERLRVGHTQPDEGGVLPVRRINAVPPSELANVPALALRCTAGEKALQDALVSHHEEKRGSSGTVRSHEEGPVRLPVIPEAAVDRECFGHIRR